MVDKLAVEYASQPVVFLEYYVNADFHTRSSRWWAAFGGDAASTPLVMVDSGNQISNGFVDFDTVYKQMVDTSLVRIPQAALEAYAWRDGNKVGFYARVQNLSGETLSPATDATVHGIVYEDIHAGVTDRYVRGAVATSINSLPSNEFGTFSMQTSDLEVADWSKLHFIVLVDYIPPGSTGAYDMLQAVQASPLLAPFDVHPDSVSYFIEPGDPLNPSTTLDVSGAGFLDWTAQEEVDWLTISPITGTITTQPLITIDTSMLNPGAQQGVVTFSTSDGYFVKPVKVKVYFGPHEQAFMPIVNR